MNVDKAIAATFIQNTYALTVNISGSGSVNRNNSGPYHLNDVVLLTAVPATGWSFSGWSGAATGSTNPKNVTITADKSVTATFIQNQYTMNIATSGEGSVTNNPDLTSYNSGSTVQLTASPASGWTFTGWSGDITGSTNPASVTMNSNKTLTATFTQNPAQYTLNINVAGEGSVTRNPDRASYTSGTSVQITAAPAVGWTFSGWSGDSTGSTNPLTVTMNANKTITATFTQNTYVLAVNVSGSGSVNRNNPGPYHLNDAVQLTAIPATGWSFSGWSGDITGTGNIITFTMNGGKAITATFMAAVPPSSGGGNGGGGGGGSAAPLPVTKPVTTNGFSSASGLKIDTSGAVQANALLKFGDSGTNLDIVKNTRLSDAKGNALVTLSVAKVDSITQPPPPQEVIVKAYEFGPGGAKFNPAITLTLSYDAETMPAETRVDSLYIAYWDGSQWMALESTKDTASHTVSTKVSHFSQYALIGRQPMVAVTPLPIPVEVGLIESIPETMEISPVKTVEDPPTSPGTFAEPSSVEVITPVPDAVSEQVPALEEVPGPTEARGINMAGLLPICLAIFLVSVISISYLSVRRKHSR